MRLQCSPECPCRPAFVCNYCLIKHAGQLPGSDRLATDTQLHTECLQPPSQVFFSAVWPCFVGTAVVQTYAAASICAYTITPTYACVTERQPVLQLGPSALPFFT